MTLLKLCIYIFQSDDNQDNIKVEVKVEPNDNTEEEAIWIVEAEDQLNDNEEKAEDALWTAKVNIIRK